MCITQIVWRNSLTLGRVETPGFSEGVFVCLSGAGGRVSALGGESEFRARPELKEEERFSFRQRQCLGLIPAHRVSEKGNSSGALPVMFVYLRREAVSSIII